MSKLYQAKHELWLKVLYSSFAIANEKIKSDLYDFAMIQFRHLKWIGSDILANNQDYNYDRNFSLNKLESVHEIIHNLIVEIKSTQKAYAKTELFERVTTDENYLIEYCEEILKTQDLDIKVTAFNLERCYGNLSQAQIDAFSLFLFEESYKEYELILVYAWMQARTNDLLQFNVYQDLIDESQFHLKSFSNMMADLGILTLPRELHEMTYKITDLKKFIIAGIAEEEAAKEMCKALSRDINDEKLSKFFDFINYQESYHIALMKKLL